MAKTSGTSGGGPDYILMSYYVVHDLAIGLQTGADRTLYATWTWEQSHTEKFKLTWRYYTGDGVWFIGSENEETSPSHGTSVRATYSAPSNAVKVSCTITPISQTYEKKSGKTSYTASYWKGASSTAYYDFSSQGYPAKPSAPTVAMDAKYKLTASLSVYDENTDYIQFEVVKNNTTTVKTGRAAVVKNYASYSWNVDAGAEYKVRAQALKRVNETSSFDGIGVLVPTIDAIVAPSITSPREFLASEWSEYSQAVVTVPVAPAAITSHRVESPTSLFLYWEPVSTATGYTVEYSVSKEYFDRSSATQSLTTTISSAYIKDLESGTTWYFRVKATNATGDSGWSPTYAVVLGVAPAAPTTWSETVSAVVGDTIRLYWMHNSEDGSSQSAAQVQISIDGGDWADIPVTNMATNTEEASYTTYETSLTEKGYLLDNNSEQILDTFGFPIDTEEITPFGEGMTIRWRVRTKGIVEEYSPWSVERALTIYAPPTIDMIVSAEEGAEEPDYTFAAFPIHIHASAGPDTQNVVGWVLSVIAANSYEAYDDAGQRVMITAGDEVFNEYIPGGSSNVLDRVLTAGDIDLANEQSYAIKLHVSMNSGLNAEASQTIFMQWSSVNLWPNAELAIDRDTLCAYIRPFCRTEEGEYIDDVTLSVYRREYDGRFMLIADGIDNTGVTTITDPHPALDWARYRIVAISRVTGQIGFYDLPAEAVGEKGIVLQWDEEWTTFNVPSGDGDGLADPVWTGSMLRLPYNIKISEKSSIDTALVEYIGRSAPVSYYGTQLGVSGSWSSDIPASDINVRYALRRLQIWKGDVYVRAPNGVGYWANVNVSFNKDYNSMLTPITIDVTRVEGGI